MQYKLSVAGGTFDHFHAGHAAFLRAVLAQSDKILLGITSDTYVQQHKSATGSIEPYATRKEKVLKFLEKEGAAERVSIEPIDSAMGPEKWAALSIEAIIVTEDTLAGAKAVNDTREKQGLEPLAVVVTDIVNTPLGKKISSTDIRSGSIDASGNAYFPESLQQKNRLLPNSERHWFQQPFGELFADTAVLPEDDPELLVTVGDVVTARGNNSGWQQKLSVVDYVVERHETHKTATELGFDGNETLLHATNPAGQLSADLTTTLKQAIEFLKQEKRILVVVAGEEDLAVIPLVLLLPLGYVILYGQPQEGIVRLVVTPSAKQHASELLAKFNIQ